MKKSGFTLIEVMIVMAIVGIVAAIAVPQFVGKNEGSKTSQSAVKQGTKSAN